MSNKEARWAIRRSGAWQLWGRSWPWVRHFFASLLPSRLCYFLSPKLAEELSALRRCMPACSPHGTLLQSLLLHPLNPAHSSITVHPQCRHCLLLIPQIPQKDPVSVLHLSLHCPISGPCASLCLAGQWLLTIQPLEGKTPPFPFVFSSSLVS